jgi:bile acid-coenzyme A ligase
VLRLMNPRLLVGGGAAGSVDLATLPEGYAPDGSLSSEPLFLPPGRYWKAMTTGGSTGRPKVIVHHRPPVLDPFSPSNGLALNDVVLMPAPPYHNAPFSLTHMALCWGAHVIETDRFDPLEILRLIEEHRVKWLYLVPTMMHRIWSLPASQRESFDLSSLEIVLHMAAPCAAWLKQAWIDWLGAERIWEMYAGTEGLGTTAISGAEWLAHKGSVGRCINGRVRVLDDLGGDRPPGEVGEVYFVPPGGRGSTYHYIGAEAKAHGDWESYGDLGWLDEQGYLYLADRRTDMILTGGANIYPAEIEAALDAHPAVASSVCVGLPDPDLGQRAHAILELKSGSGVPAPAELAKFLAGRIARFKVPYSFEVASEPLRDDAGKVRRSALRDSRMRQAEKGLQFLPLRDQASM